MKASQVQRILAEIEAISDEHDVLNQVEVERVADAHLVINDTENGQRYRAEIEGEVVFFDKIAK